MRQVMLSVAAVILGALAPIAASQEPAKAAPASAFAVLHYDLKTGITPASRSLETTAGVTIESRAAGLRTVRLYLHREFTVRQVADAGRPLTFTQPKDTGDKLMFSPEAVPLEIDLGRDLAKGERVTLVIDYGGPISNTINNVNVISPALTELASYAAWYPKEKENGAFTYELALTLPVDHTVAVTDGREVSASPSATTITRVFKRDDRGFDIPIVTGPGLKIRERRAGNLVAQVVFRDLDESLALSALDGAVQCTQDMTTLFGPPAVSGAVIVLFSPRNGWGYSRVPLILGPEANAKARLATEAGRVGNFRGLAHEAAHFWWNLANTSTSDDWLNESLAEYFSIRTVERIVDHASFTALWKDQHRAANNVPQEQTVLGTLRNDPAAYALYYQRGSWIFRTLETWLGRAELDRMLTRFYRQHRGRRDATTDTFLAVVRQSTGLRFDPFFDRLLRRGGLPQLRFRWTAASREVAGTMTLDDPALVGFPLTVRFDGRQHGETMTRTVLLQPGETTWRFALPFDPVDATMDPDWRVLRDDPDVSLGAGLVPLVHGPDMDALPELIPKANIAKAKAIVDAWAKSLGRSPLLDFERGWLALLEGRTSEAITYLEAVLPRLEELPHKAFRIPSTYAYLGRLHDTLGNRQVALGYYREGLRRAAEFEQIRSSPGKMMWTFHNNLEVPYPRGRSVHVAAWLGYPALVQQFAADSPALVNSEDPYVGVTPIVWAVQGQTIKRPVIEMLVELGADVNAKDKKGQTVLEIVRAKGDTELAAYLVSKGAK